MLTTPSKPNFGNNSVLTKSWTIYGRKTGSALSETIPMEMLKHPPKQFLAWSLCLLSIISQSLSARTLASPPSGPQHRARRAISFCMLDVLSYKRLSSRPATAKMSGGDQLPFSKPVGFSHPRGSVPLTGTDPGSSVTGVSSQTLDLEGISMSFPAIATLQELEFGTVTAIDQDIYGVSGFGYAQSLGKLQGMYVAGSEDGSSHMMAVTASFVGSKYNDELRFFGVHRPDVVESHIAVIGGTGKYHNANGYATVKTLNESSTSANGKGEGVYKVLQFNVYLG